MTRSGISSHILPIIVFAQFAGTSLWFAPNAVISELSTGKSLRLEVYCEEKVDAEKIKEQFGGSIRELKMQNWVAMAEVARPPLKIRDAIVVVAEREGDEVERVREEYPERHLIKM